MAYINVCWYVHFWFEIIVAPTINGILNADKVLLIDNDPVLRLHQCTLFTYNLTIDYPVGIYSCLFNLFYYFKLEGSGIGN